MKKKNSTIKKLTILLSIIVIIFTVINLIWYLGVDRQYNKFCNKLVEVSDSNGRYYEKISNGYHYKIKRPSYMDFGGFLMIEDEEGSWVEYNSAGEPINSNGLCIALYIWPDIFGNYKYGVSFDDEIQDIFLQAIIDENLNFIPYDLNNTEFNTIKEMLINENKDEILALIDNAKTMWNF